MRAKALWTYISAKFSVRLVYSRITHTRSTTFYFCFALAYCIVQVILQSLTYQDNAWVVRSIASTLASTNVTEKPCVIEDGHLKACDGIPGQSECTMLCHPESTFRVQDTSRSTGAAHNRLTASLLFSTDEVNEECVQSIFWLKDLFQDGKREDVVTISFQLWLFALSFCATVNESIPHLATVIISHVLDTVWASARINATKELEWEYNTFVKDGACNGLNVFQGWWDLRMQHAIPILVFNGVALLAMGLVSYGLFSTYEKQTFMRLGASDKISRFYKLLLLFSACLQLSGFFLMASAGIWISKVSFGVIHKVVPYIRTYEAAFIVTALLILPWLVTGWKTVRQETRGVFIAYAVIGLELMGIWIGMFASSLYRYTFRTWPFFAFVTVTGFVFLTATFVLGLVCRLNYGKGLAEHLQAQEAEEGADFAPVVFTRQVQPETETRFNPSIATRLAHKRSSLLSAFSRGRRRESSASVRTTITTSSGGLGHPSLAVLLPPPAYMPSPLSRIAVATDDLRSDISDIERKH